MTDKTVNLPTPTGWAVMPQYQDGPYLVIPVWANSDSDGDTLVIMGHPGGVMMNGSLDPDIPSVSFTARCVLAACESVNEQRIHGQAAVERLLESARPEGGTTTLQDLIKRSIEETQQGADRANILDELFTGLRKAFEDIERRKPDSQPEQGGEP